MSAQITLVSASAGTGKTYRLGTALLDAVESLMLPQKVLATTFTNRAAAELLARGRDRLLAGGQHTAALNLMLARVGTVNAVFGGILADSALENGRSPVVAVIPDAAQTSVFRIAADSCLEEHAPILDALADKFEFFQVNKTWQKMLTDLVAAARSNGIAAPDFGASAERSIATLMAALPAPLPSGEALDAALVAAAVKAVADLRSSGDKTRETRTSLEQLEQITGRLERHTATWADWARLSKLEAAKVGDPFLKPVREAAAHHPQHPQLHADIACFVRTMFAAAAQSLELHQRYKRAQGLVDFVDQEADALDLLTDPIAARRIAGETDLLLVDEFQDTSPIQLALFLRLSALVGRTIFVGDTKQAIYGFRGADPGLVDAVARSLEGRADVKRETLPTNRRSRPALVKLVNAVFGAALPAFGIPREQVEVEAHREDTEGQAPALALWRVHGKNKTLAGRALAQRVAQVLRERERWPVQPQGGATTRPIRGGDIAILVRINSDAAAVADALAAAGLKVALSRGGLLSRAECVVAMAGLRFIADGSDTLALAEIAHVLEGASDAPAWLATALTSPEPTAVLRTTPFAEALAAERAGADTLTPAETLDRAIAVLDVHGVLAAWGDPAARYANLGALRGLATEYEAEYQRDRLPATASGLAAWLATKSEAEQPASPDPDAVQVVTCHSSKGLEWPMVILADLDNSGEARLFNAPVAMPRDGGLNPADPLAGRWIRLWPWPYGKTSKDVHLDTSAPATAEGRAAGEAARAEAARLLYVAMTRARDYMVLAPRLLSSKSGLTICTEWLDLLPGTPRPLVLPAAGENVQAAGEQIAATVEDIAAAEDAAADPLPVYRSPIPAEEPPSFPPRRFTPSAADAALIPAWRVVTIGDRLPLRGTVDMTACGEALHSFFAADRPKAEPAWRKALADRLLAAWGVSALRAEDAVIAADRLWAYLGTEHPGGTWRREWPVTRVCDGQVLSGWIDLLVEEPSSLSVYDHKSFPGGHERWPEVVAEHAAQLAAYVDALRAATSLAVLRQAIHLPVGGVVLVLET